MRRAAFVFVAVFLWLALLGATAGVVQADIVPRMPKEELKGLIVQGDVVILDVRTGWDWSQTDSKIKGAVREAPGQFESWASKYEREKTIVLYCA